MGSPPQKAISTDFPPPYGGNTHTASSAPPSYANDLQAHAHFLLKPELSSPKTPWPGRRWRQVVLHLQGTRISIRQSSGYLLCARPLSLEGAQVGLATDYSKKGYVFRLRVEGFQLLFATASLPSALAWVDRLSAAVAVSGDLDERVEPAYRYKPLTGTGWQKHGIGRPSRRSSLGKWKDRCWSRDKDDVWLRDQALCPECSTDADDGKAQFVARTAQKHSASRQGDPGAEYNRSGSQLTASRRTSLATSCGREKGVDGEDTLGSRSSTELDTSLDLSPLGLRNLEIAIRCTATLRYGQSWRPARYVREDKWIAIRDYGKEARDAAARRSELDGKR